MLWRPQRQRVAPAVGEETLQGDEIEHLPRAIARQDASTRFVGDGSGGVEVGGEVRQVAFGEEDLAVVTSAVGLDAVEGGRRRLQVASHHREVP